MNTAGAVSQSITPTAVWSDLGAKSQAQVSLIHHIEERDVEHLLPKNPAHRARFDVAEKLYAAYLNAESGIWVYGPTGCGKSQEVKNFLAVLQIPAVCITGNPYLRRSDFIGHYVAKNGATEWMDGAVTRAMRENRVILIEEFDFCDPAETSWIHEVVDNRAITIPQTGEKVVAGDRFAIYITANSGGAGDVTGNYAGVRDQNRATRRRFCAVRMDYLPAEQEKEIIRPLLADMAKDVQEYYLEHFHAIAAKSRNLFASGSSSFVMDTGMLYRWAKFAVAFGLSGQDVAADRPAIRKAFDFSGGAFLENDEAATYDVQLRIEFGD